MKEGWTVKPLEKLCEISRGGSPRPIKKFLTDAPDGVNWIKISDATASSKYIYETKEKIKPEGVKHSRLVSEGDFILSNSMSFGHPYIMKTSGCIHDGWLVLHENSGLIDADYLYHFLESKAAYEQFDRLASGSTVRNLNINVVKNVQIPLPPLPEQKRIVAILDEAFAGISQAIANTERNIQNARELFEGYLNQVFLKEDGSWNNTTIGSFSEVYDGPHATPKTVDSGPIFLGISSLQNGSINLAETRHVTDEDFVKWTRRVKPQENDIVFSYETKLGQAAIIPHGLSCCLGRRMGLVRVNPELIDPKFFLYEYLSPVFKKFLDSKTVHGATVDRIPLKEFPQFPFNYPSVDIQQRIINRLDQLSYRVGTLEALYQQKLTALAELKQSILQKAFTGQLTDNLPL